MLSRALGCPRDAGCSLSLFSPLPLTLGGQQRALRWQQEQDESPAWLFPKDVVGLSYKKCLFSLMNLWERVKHCEKPVVVFFYYYCYFLKALATQTGL